MKNNPNLASLAESRRAKSLQEVKADQLAAFDEKYLPMIDEKNATYQKGEFMFPTGSFAMDVRQLFESAMDTVATAARREGAKEALDAVQVEEKEPDKNWFMTKRDEGFNQAVAQQKQKRKDFEHGE